MKRSSISDVVIFFDRSALAETGKVLAMLSRSSKYLTSLTAWKFKAEKSFG
jgi:hypothetical protein